MRLLRRSGLALGLCLALMPVHAQSAPYRNPSLPIDARVKDLLQRMTLEEKVAQLESTWQNHGQNMAPNLFFVDENSLNGLQLSAGLCRLRRGFLCELFLPRRLAARRAFDDAGPALHSCTSPISSPRNDAYACVSDRR